MTEQRWLAPGEQRMWRAYLAARRALDVAIDRQLAEAGLSTADFELLVPLSEAAEGVLRARDLGRVIGWDRSRLSHQLRRMEQRGLIERFTCATDARGTMIRLTGAGRAVLVETAPGHVATVRRVFVDRLSTDELGTLTEAFERVAAAVPACPLEAEELEAEGADDGCDDDPVPP